MNIQEAVKIAIKTDSVMYRDTSRRDYADRYATIKPTNSYDACILIANQGQKRKSCRHWNPTADDLMANDWKVAKE